MYPTNISNQARAAVDQTMIVGLGQAFDGTDAITVSNPPGLDPEARGEPGVLSMPLEPRPDGAVLSLEPDDELQPAAGFGPDRGAEGGTFLFGQRRRRERRDEACYLPREPEPPRRTRTSRPPTRRASCAAGPTAGSCLAGRAIPRKCSASRRCSRAITTSWNTHRPRKALHVAPRHLCVADAHDADQHGVVVPIVRRAQLCATLGNRLGLDDVCGFERHPAAVRERRQGISQLRLPSPPLLRLRTTTTAVAVTASNPAAPCQYRERMPEVRAPAARGFAAARADGYRARRRRPSTSTAPNSTSGGARSSRLLRLCRRISEVVVDAGSAYFLFERDGDRQRPGHDVDRRHRARPDGPRLEVATRKPIRDP